MFKLCFVAFFALLAAAFAAPKPDPITLTYESGIPLAQPLAQPLAYNPIAYSGLGYNGIPYAAGYYNYYGTPLAYRNLYY